MEFNCVKLKDGNIFYCPESGNFVTFRSVIV